MLLTKDEILRAEDGKTYTVPVPEWGGEVLVRAASAAERDAFEESLIGPDGKPLASLANFRARLVALLAVDCNGTLLFTAADVARLGGKSARALERVYRVCRYAMGMTDEDVSELVKNCDGGPGGDSHSG